VYLTRIVCIFPKTQIWGFAFSHENLFVGYFQMKKIKKKMKKIKNLFVGYFQMKKKKNDRCMHVCIGCYALSVLPLIVH